MVNARDKNPIYFDLEGVSSFFIGNDKAEYSI